MRRERTERLLLVDRTGKTTELGTGLRREGAVDSQDAFLVSPDGAHLAWRLPAVEDDALHLRAADGRERRIPRYAGNMRFSPDGRWLAALVTVGRGDWYKLLLVEPATGATRGLVTRESLGRFEWSGSGLAIASRDELLYAPLDGEPRTLFQAAPGERLSRFVAPAGGGRVLVFVERRDGRGGQRVRVVAPGRPAEARELGWLPGYARAENAEMSADGRRAVFTTGGGLYLVDGDAAPRPLSGKRDVHSLWFAPEANQSGAAGGRLAYASPTGATVIDGRTARRFKARAPGERLRMARFEPGSSRLLLAVGREARAWDPRSGATARLATAPAGQDLLGVDAFRGGVILWTDSGGPRPTRSAPVARVLFVGPDGAPVELERNEDWNRSISLQLSPDGRFVAWKLSHAGARLRGVDGPTRTLAPAGEEPLGSTEFAFSPDGRWLVLVKNPARSGTRGEVVLVGVPTGTARLSANGPAIGTPRPLLTWDPTRELPRFAFSPDGSWLAVARKEPTGGDTFRLFAVATAEERAQFTVDTAYHAPFAWTRRGLLVAEPAGLRLWTPGGERRSIIDGPVDSFLATKAGDRIYQCQPAGYPAGARVFTEGKVEIVDVDDGGPARSRPLHLPHCWSLHTWLSSDGRWVAYRDPVDGRSEADLFLEGGPSPTDPPRRIGRSYGAVAFDARGRLAYTSHRGLTVVGVGEGAERERQLDSDEAVEAFWFEPGASRLRLAAGRDLVSWDPDTGATTTLARAPEGQRILDAGPFAGGFVLLTEGW